MSTGDCAYGKMVTIHCSVYFPTWLILRFIPQWIALDSPDAHIVPVGITNRWAGIWIFRMSLH